MSRTDKVDEIRIYRTNDEWRWTRKTRTNHKIVGASSEGYTRLKGAVNNIKRTQKEPFDLFIME